jgi:hypothetical protein
MQQKSARRENLTQTVIFSAELLLSTRNYSLNVRARDTCDRDGGIPVGLVQGKLLAWFNPMIRHLQPQNTYSPDDETPFDFAQDKPSAASFGHISDSKISAIRVMKR